MQNSTYLYSEFTTLKAGDGFRLFPFGRVYKGGKAHDITPEFAKSVKLPHFAAAIKLGSHEDTTPAGGFITALEVRDDGLYAIPEWNEAGQKAIDNGAFRFNSPEILWDGGLENPKDGSVIRAPMIVGTALLHTPHLGNDAALYSVEPITQEIKTMDENISVPRNLWDKFTAFLDSKITPPEPQKVDVIPEDYTALKSENEKFKAEQTKRENADKAATLKAGIVTELQNKDNFGMSYVELKAADEAATVLAGMSTEQRDWVMKNFRAFIVQIDTTKLTTEKGSEGNAIEDPKAAFNALVLKYSAEKRVDYNAAFEIIKTENADLFASAFVKKEK